MKPRPIVLARAPAFRRRVLASTTFAAALSWTVVSAAQHAGDPALAESLFDAGQACLARNDWACACDKFGASMQAEPAASTLINVAKCQEHDGKLTLAWTTLKDALKLNRTLPYTDESRRATLEQFAQKRLDEVDKRIPRLRVVLANRPDGVVLRRDGALVPLAALDEPLRVDPGSHELVVEAPGFRTERRMITFADGQEQAVWFTLVKPAEAAAAPAPAPGPPPSSPEAGPISMQRTAALVVGGAGVVGLGAAGVLGVVTLSKSSSADGSDACRNPVDNPTILQCNALRDDARGIQTAAIVAAIAAGVLLETGVVLWATAPKPSNARARAPHLQLMAQGAGATFAGAF